MKSLSSVLLAVAVLSMTGLAVSGHRARAEAEAGAEVTREIVAASQAVRARFGVLLGLSALDAIDEDNAGLGETDDDAIWLGWTAIPKSRPIAWNKHTNKGWNARTFGTCYTGGGHIIKNRVSPTVPE